MKKTTTNINQERSEKYRYLEKLNYVPRFIIISACCGFLAGVALILSVLAMYNSTDAKAKVDYELPRMQSELILLKNSNTLNNLYMQELYVELKSQGFDPPPLPGE